VIAGAESFANTVFLPTNTGHALALGYISGKVLYHPPGQPLPKRTCLSIRFADDSHLTCLITLWGLVRVLGDEDRREYVLRWYGQAVEPGSEQCTWEGFRDAADAVSDAKLSVKKFLHDFGPCHYVAGIDSGYAIEILHRAKVHPKRRPASLGPEELRACYDSVGTVMAEAVAGGGRHSETDLYGQPGGFVPRVCKDTLGQPCHECGTRIQKISLEGGACYLCPTCQKL